MSFVPQENVLYKFTSGLDDDMVLDVSGNPKSLNTMILYKWNNGANQKFALRAVGNNRYAIFCSKANTTIEAPQGKNENGAAIISSQPNKTENEFW
jgi:hypothetical protein